MLILFLGTMAVGLLAHWHVRRTYARHSRTPTLGGHTGAEAAHEILRQAGITGVEESAKLKAETDKQRTILLAQAKQDAEKLRGEGDGTATRVYAEAYGKDAEFYAFVRSLQAYEQFLGKRSTLVLPADADLFRYLSSPQPRPATNVIPARTPR